MAIVFALGALLGWAVGDVFVTFAVRKIGNFKTLFWQLLIATFISSLYIPFALPIADYRMLLFSFILGVIHLLGVLCYFKGLEIGNASLVGTISGSFSLLVVILSLIVFRESLNLFQVLGIACVLAGVFLVSFQLHDIKRIEFSKDKGIIYALLAMLFWGVYFAFIKIPATKIGWFWQPYTYNLTVFILLIYSLFKKQKLFIGNNSKTIFPIVASAILLTLGHFSYNLGILRGFSSIVAPIAGSQTTLFVILAQFIFKERMAKQQVAGVVATILGITILSFT